MRLEEFTVNSVSGLLIPHERLNPLSPSMSIPIHHIFVQDHEKRRCELIAQVCGPINIPAQRQKSENSKLQLNLFHDPASAHLMLPKNRALLLDYLQRECQRFNFRRETYYLSQSYLDGYLERETIEIKHL